MAIYLGSNAVNMLGGQSSGGGSGGNVWQDQDGYVHLDNEGGESAPVLTTKTITANGTYNASSDSADGYSSVTVNVSGGGGANNIVIGTFTGTTAGASMNVSIPYTGSGYPIMIEIEPTGGYVKSGLSSVVQRYVIVYYLLSKSDITVAPSYSASQAGGDSYMALNSYKNSSSDPETIGKNGSTPTVSFSNSSANAYATNTGGVVCIHSATEISVFIASTSYGFRANTEYTYRIIYSS